MSDRSPIAIGVTSDQGCTRIVASGEIDSHTAPGVDEAITEAISSGATTLILDFSGVTFLSSAGLSSLVAAKRRIDDLRLLRGNRQVDRLIALAGLEDLYGEPS